MATIFIRHNFGEPPYPELQYLYNHSQIAIRFDNIPSLNPDEYQTSGKAALKRLQRYCDTGALVGATYRGILPGEILVGRILPGTEIKVQELGGYHHKTVQLIETKCLSYRDFPILAIQPILNTFSKWSIGESHLADILEGKPLKWRVDSLLPAQLEVLCYEYLREKGLLAALVLPIGRGLPDIDIYGIDASDNPVIAQVTHRGSIAKIGDKKERLREYGKETDTLVFFGPESRRFSAPDIQYISTEEVFAHLTSGGDHSTHHRLVSRMLNRG